MILKGIRFFIGIAGLSIALFSAGAVEAQLYVDRPSIDTDRRVVTWGNHHTVVPQGVVDGDWLLTGWGPSIVETPGLALVQLSTGKSLWTVTAEPEDFLTGWLIDGRVHVLRHSSKGDIAEHQIRDPATGAVQHTESIPFGPDTTVIQYLATVFIAGHKEVFDRRTGDRRGALPADVNYNQLFREIAGRLYAGSLPDQQTKQVELLEIDLGSLEITRRLNLNRLLPDHPYRSLILSNGHYLIIVVANWSQPAMSPRSLAAIDLEGGQLAWQTEVAPHAPLLFVHDLSVPPELPSDLALRPLLIEWSTGQQRLGELPDRGHADLTQWLTYDHSRVADQREFDDGIAMHITSQNGTNRLVGLNMYGLPVWHRDLGVALLRMSDRVAVISGAYQLELVDLRTGETTHCVTPKSVGLVSKFTSLANTNLAATTTKRSAAPPPPGWQLPDNVTIPAVALILLLGYLLVRRVALRPGGNPPGTL